MDSSVTTKITVSPPSAGGPNGNIRRRHETAADTKKNNKAEPSQEQEKLLVSPIVMIYLNISPNSCKAMLF